MKFLKKLCKFLVAIFLLLGTFVLVCAFNPELTKRVSSFVNKDKKTVDYPVEETTIDEPESLPEGDSLMNIVVPNGITNNNLNGTYVVPDMSALDISKQVDGKSGLSPIIEDGEEIKEKEAKLLEKDFGFLGEEYDFPDDTFPYFGMLDEDMQTLYRQIYANLIACKESFTPSKSVRMNLIGNVFQAVFNDHPEIFWAETAYSCKYTKDGECVLITLKYNDTVNNLDNCKEKFDNAIGNVVALCENTNDSEKALHDYLCSYITYNKNAPLNQSAYSAIVNGQTVCAGYAKAFVCVMRELGQKAYYCIGYSGEDHAWNIVKKGDLFWNTDVTFDDQNPMNYDYFNKSDSDFAKDHIRTGLSVYLPACVGNAQIDVPAQSEEVVENPDETASSAETEEEIRVPTVEEITAKALEGYINENPIEPLDYEAEKDGLNRLKSTLPPEEYDASVALEKRLKEAKLEANDVCFDLKSYYADCLVKLVKAGSGEVVISSVIDDKLWNDIENAYITGKYKEGYMDAALKTLKKKNVEIQVVGDRLGNGFIRVYHAIYTSGDVATVSDGDATKELETKESKSK